MHVPQKTPLERVFHALAFEVIATILCAPLFSWLLGLPLTQMGALTIMFALVAMAWNMVFNALFERVERRYGLDRSRLRGHQGQQIWTEWSILAYNADTLVIRTR